MNAIELAAWRDQAATANEAKAAAVEECLVHLDNVSGFLRDRAATAVRECEALLRSERNDLLEAAAEFRRGEER